MIIKQKLSILFLISLVFTSTACAQVFDEDQIPTISNAKLTDMTENTIKMRNNPSNGDPLDTKISELVLESLPSVGDFLLCENESGELRKCAVDEISGVADGNGIYSGGGTLQSGSNTTVNIPSGRSLNIFTPSLQAGLQITSSNESILTGLFSSVRVGGSDPDRGIGLVIANSKHLEVNGESGLVGQVLSSNGSGQNPEWQSVLRTQSDVAALGFLASEVDGSVTNEIQTLSLSGSDILLTDGGSVTVPFDGNGIFDGGGTLIDTGNTTVNIPSGRGFNIFTPSFNAGLQVTSGNESILTGQFSSVRVGGSGSDNGIKLIFASSKDLRINGDAGADGQVLTSNGEFSPPTWEDAGSPDAVDVGQVNSIAAGNTLGLQQEILASDGQIGQTVLAVAYASYQGSEVASTNHKAQVTSLGDGNTMFVYANGDDFNNNVVQEGPIFLSLGEIYVVENVSSGAILTFSEGGYGFSQQRNGNDESPMPLLSVALGFKNTFVFGFRNSQTYRGGTNGSDNEGWIHVVGSAVDSTCKLTNGSGATIQGQENILIPAWSYQRLYTEGNIEYVIDCTNPVMAAINANMDNTTPRFYDSRLVLPLTNDGITWPRSGFVSAPFSGTVVDFWVNDGAEGTIATVNPGGQVDFDAAPPVGTGASDPDYEPRGATRVKAAGLIVAYSGADSAGLEASPMAPVSTFTQRIALPLHIRDSGDGGNNGIACASTLDGVAKIFQWNAATGQAEQISFNDESGSPATELLLRRRTDDTELTAAANADAQLHPASFSLQGATDPNAYQMTSDFTGGYIESDVPMTCVFNSEQNENGATDHTFRGTSGAAVVGIHSDDDEQLTYGITPEEIRAEVTRGTDGKLYKRVVTSGVETWIDG